MASPMMNAEAARAQMVEQQVRAWEVLDPAVLDAMGSVPRERYVPAPFADVAYADAPIPLGGGRHILAPSVDGRILQAVAVRSGETVLEIGTGSGFLAACLAALGASVRSLEIDPDLAREAAARLRADGRAGVEVEAVDATTVAPVGAYDVVILSASLPVYDPRYQGFLKVGGRLLVVVGHAAPMEALLITRTDVTTFTRESLFETELEALIHAVAPSAFRF
jgi:protein-L-isoaspartate(D-aspartate) O-methyltransferase